MFADDTNLFLFHKKADTLFARVDVELENVVNVVWVKQNVSKR